MDFVESASFLQNDNRVDGDRENQCVEDNTNNLMLDENGENFQTSVKIQVIMPASG